METDEGSRCAGWNWHAVAFEVRRELRRHSFNERERTLVDTVIGYSWDLGRAVMLAASHTWFVGPTGIRSDHVMDTLRDLEEARVLAIRWEAGEYQVMADARVWRRKARAREAEASAAHSSLMRAAVGTELFQEPSLRMELANVARRSAIEAMGGTAVQTMGYNSFLDRGPGELPGRAGAALVNCQDGAGDDMRRDHPGPGDLPGSGLGPILRSGSCGLQGASAQAIEGNVGVAHSPTRGEAGVDCSPSQGAAPRVGEKTGIFPESGSNVVQRLNVSSMENVETLKRFRESASPSQGLAVKRPRDERELVGRIRALVGEEDWGYYAGAWVVHGVRKHPTVVEKVIADVEAMKKEKGGWVDGYGRPIRNKGAWCWRLFKLFGGGK